MDISSFSISELHQQYRKHQLSPVEVVNNYLERIGRINPLLNCYLTITSDSAIAQAKEAEKSMFDLDDLPCLFGIPVALKDLFETKGIRTTAGSKIFADYIPIKNAYIVNKIYAAGGILLGKLNMHEIALGVTNVNPHFGLCRNPWDSQRIAGGSSGGSAVALAAHICLGSMGSDTGGSIRIPASFCGIVGMKPTFGRISSQGLIPLSWSLDHAGPMAWCAKDAALLLQATVGYDINDPMSINYPIDNYLENIDGGIKNWRIAVPKEKFFNEVDAQIRLVIQQAIEVFRNLGAQIDYVELPNIEDASRANGLIITSEAAVIYGGYLQQHPDKFGQDVLNRLRSGSNRTTTEYILARNLQVQLRRQFELFFSQYRILLLPTTPIVAPSIENLDAVEQARILTQFTAPFNFTGLPAISIPCGASFDGLPVGLQIIARPWAESDLLTAATAYEKETRWYCNYPIL